MFTRFIESVHIALTVEERGRFIVCWLFYLLCFSFTILNASQLYYILCSTKEIVIYYDFRGKVDCIGLISWSPMYLPPEGIFKSNFSQSLSYCLWIIFKTILNSPLEIMLSWRDWRDQTHLGFTKLNFVRFLYCMTSQSL